MSKSEYRCGISILTAVFLSALAGCASPAGGTAIPAETSAPEPTSTEAASAWTPVGEAVTPVNIRMAAFLNSSVGVIGGANTEGIARTTSDGGKTWVPSSASSACLFGLDILDEQTVWECNASDIRVSVDGGATFSDQIRGSGSPGCKISGVDAKTAFAVQPGRFSVTHDGGMTREMLALPADLTSREVAAISFRSATEGYLLDGSGTLHATTDGGKTWAAMPSPDMSPYGEMKVTASEGIPYAAIRFLDADNGLMVLSLIGGGASRVVALRTSDGGKTWTEQVIETKIGIPYLSPDGRFLTIAPMMDSMKVLILEDTGG